jgi:hypothetical protein
VPTAGQRVLAADFTATAYDESSTEQTNIGSSYATGSPEVGITFTAPTSGKVLVVLAMRSRDNGASSTVVLDFRLYEDDSGGSLILDEGATTRRMEVDHDNDSRTAALSKSYLVQGLTGGQAYYAQCRHFASPSGSADLIYRAITALPQPA